MKTNPYTNPYKSLLALGVQMDNHESDLYVEATPEAVALVKASGWSHSLFSHNVTGALWVEFPFAYEPFWEARTQNVGTPD